MLEERLKVFLEAVKADTGLQEKLKGAADANAVVAIAKDAGFVISVEALKTAQYEVSGAELEGVAGGCNAFMTGMADYIYSVFNPANKMDGSSVCTH